MVQTGERMAAPALVPPEQDLADLIRAGRAHELDLRGAFLVSADLSELDLSSLDLTGADLSCADLRGANLMLANLEGASLFEARLEETDLSAANLVGADLRHAIARKAGFGRANLSGATMSEGDFREASFVQARLDKVSAEGASFIRARLKQASLIEADLAYADLTHAELEDVDWTEASLRRADLRHSSLRGARGYGSADWIGADLREADFNGAYLLRREAIDQNYLDEFRRQSSSAALVFQIWKLTSDCGRSITRWGLWTAFIAVFFAGIYAYLPIAYSYDTPLAPLYFSVVTLTTLGYGDALPTTLLGQGVVMCQVVVGYVMLGGLLSIFSGKMATRGD
jgi:uncharacterized protein YjbI with pentapeptide repeats